MYGIRVYSANKAATAPMKLRPISGLKAAESGVDVASAAPRADVTMAEADATADGSGSSDTAAQILVAREMVPVDGCQQSGEQIEKRPWQRMADILLLSSLLHFVSTHVPALVMKALLPLPQRHAKSVVEHPAASAPVSKQGMAHVGSWETRSGNDVEFWAATTAAKRERAAAWNCIV